MKEWSFQLYSARDFPPLKENLRLLSEIGYSQVEGYGGLYNDTEKFRSMVDGYGLTMPTGHFDMGLLRGNGAGGRIGGKLGTGI